MDSQSLEVSSMLLFCRHTVHGLRRDSASFCRIVEVLGWLKWEIGHLRGGVGTYGEHVGYGVENELSWCFNGCNEISN